MLLVVLRHALPKVVTVETDTYAQHVNRLSVTSADSGWRRTASYVMYAELLNLLLVLNKFTLFMN